MPRTFEELAHEERLHQLYGPAAPKLLKEALRRLMVRTQLQVDPTLAPASRTFETAQAGPRSESQRVLPVAVAVVQGAAVSAAQLEAAARLKEASLLIAMLPAMRVTWRCWTLGKIRGTHALR